MKKWLAIVRLFTSAPKPKANVDAQAYEVRWVAWIISNGWRILVNFLNSAGRDMPDFFEHGGSLGVNVTTEVMAIVCDARDDVNALTWAGDLVNNTGSSFSSLGKLLDQDTIPPENPNVPISAVGTPMKYVATFVALGGNVYSFANAGATLVNAAEGNNMWTGIL